MSWRVLFLILLVAGIAAWQGGMRLGTWLVEQAPLSIASAPSSDTTEVLDADGKPLAPQPPQPRIDGTLGVPREMAPIEWTVEAVIASYEDANSSGKKSDDDDDDEDKEKSSERRDYEASAAGRGLPTGPRDVATVDLGLPGVGPGAKPQPQAPARATSIPAPLGGAWQQALKKDLEQCSKQGFFQRPSCIQNARNKYCAPNNAWGKVSDCPAPATEQIIGG
jgi:hypothetical protein